MRSQSDSLDRCDRVLRVRFVPLAISEHYIHTVIDTLQVIDEQACIAIQRYRHRCVTRTALTFAPDATPSDATVCRKS